MFDKMEDTLTFLVLAQVFQSASCLRSADPPESSLAAPLRGGHGSVFVWSYPGCHTIQQVTDSPSSEQLLHSFQSQTNVNKTSSGSNVYFLNGFHTDIQDTLQTDRRERNPPLPTLIW